MKDKNKFLKNKIKRKNFQSKKAFLKNSGLMIAFSLLFLFSGCLQEPDDIDPGELSNQQKMQQLNIEDPLIWNSNVTQSIELTPDENTLTKSARAVNYNEFPKGGDYYFALFEDLFPSEGDYDFNDVMVKSKLGLSKRGNEVTGYVNSTLLNKGGALPVEIGLMFYTERGKTYTRIPNEDISVNGQKLEADGAPWATPLNELGESWTINFSFNHKSANVWIAYFIETEKGEIMSSGFAPSHVEKFTLPHPAFLTEQNLPWGLEIETDELAIPNEKELFLNAFPEFEEWAKSGGVKNKKWFKSPDPKYTWKN